MQRILSSGKARGPRPKLRESQGTDQHFRDVGLKKGEEVA
jgi:hypothetical protein